MAKRTNPYRGILRPVEVGKGQPEVAVLVLYDVESDRVRGRVADACLDYGLERIQFSAFLGRLNRNRRQELALRLRREIADESARVRMIPIGEAELAHEWRLDQYRPAADHAAARATAALPRLRIIGAEGD